MKRYLTLTLLLTLLVAGRPSPAWGQIGEGRLVVRVEMGTAGEPLPEGLEAELLFLPDGQGPPVRFRQPVEPDGSTIFTDLDTAPQHRYVVRVSYGGYDFFSDLLAFERGSELTTTVTVYATSDEVDRLTFGPINILADVRGEQWLVGVLYVITNPTDRLIVPPAGSGPLLPLPAGARDLTFEDPQLQVTAQQVEGGVRLETAFMPGHSRILFSFTLPYRAPEQTLTIPVKSDARVGLLVADIGQEAEAVGLQPLERIQGQDGRFYLAFQAETPPADGVVEVRLRDLPNAESLAPPESPAPVGPEETVPVGLDKRLPRWTPVVGVVLALLAVGVYVWRRPAPPKAAAHAELLRRRDELIAFIARLDERFEAGRMGERAYRQQREAAKQELKAILHQIWSSQPPAEREAMLSLLESAGAQGGDEQPI